MVQKWAIEGESPRRSRASGQTYTRAFGAIGGVLAVVLFKTVIAPTYFPMIPGQGFDQAQMMVAGIVGGVGGAVGAGRSERCWIEGGDRTIRAWIDHLRTLHSMMQLLDGGTPSEPALIRR